MSRWPSASYVSVWLAFWWERWVSHSIGAIVVDCIFRADPLQPSVLICVKVLEILLVPPSRSLGCTELGLDRSLAPINVETPVGRNEWGLGPVRLLKPTSCGPIIGVPQTGVDLHGLVEWEFHSQVFQILEHPDWYVVHKEADWLHPKSIPTSIIEISIYRFI